MKQKLEGALALEGQPVKRGTMAHEHIVYMMLAEAAVQARDAVGIEEYAPPLAELSARDGHQPYLAMAHRAQGVAHTLNGRHKAAQKKLEEALEIFEALGLRWQIGRTRFELGELARTASDPAAARAQYSAALDEFEALDASPDVKRTQEALEGI